MYDIVYFVKEDKKNEELRYSLRSLSNFPHNKVHFYGGCPDSIKPDYYHKVIQNEDTKWKNVNLMLKMACNNPNITDNFWLFNDDFFIMEKIEDPKNYRNGDLYKRIVQLEDKWERITPYSQQLRNMCKELEALGCTTLNYALHVPMLINKAKAKYLLSITDSPMFRCLYGNYYNLEAEYSNDVKIIGNKKYKKGCYLSTDDNSFNSFVGDQIRKKFNTKCKYEL